MKKYYTSINRKKLFKIILIAILIITLLASISFNIYLYFFGDSFSSYLQSEDEIFTMESGILYNNRNFAKGQDYKLDYDFDNEEYKLLTEKYKIDEIAGEGTEFERAVRLMNEFAPRLTHKSDYDNHIEINALKLLEYSLDNSKNGINCRSKAQILNEMCLALGIYSRKVWICPYSIYDNDCHVVNEIYDTNLAKWVMLDITNNEYWVNEKGEPLSVLEIREYGVNQIFCTPVGESDDNENLQKLKQKNIADFLYIMKNMVYFQYCSEYTNKESDTIYSLMPESLAVENMISESSVNEAPC